MFKLLVVLAAGLAFLRPDLISGHDIEAMRPYLGALAIALLIQPWVVSHLE